MASNNGYATISGADMVVFFGFREIYLNNTTEGTDFEKSQRYVWFDVGTATQIRFVTQSPAGPKYTMDSLNPSSISKGLQMSQGDIVFKNFNEDSVNYILRKIKGNLSEKYKIMQNVDYENEGYAAIYEGLKVDETLDENDIEGFWSEDVMYWDQVPPFNIMVIAKSSDYDKFGTVSKVEIMNVKVTDIGSAESVDSTEVNDIVKFVSVSGVNAWQEKTPTDVEGV
jgi:hypothetical protein